MGEKVNIVMVSDLILLPTHITGELKYHFCSDQCS